MERGDGGIRPEVGRMELTGSLFLPHDLGGTLLVALQLEAGLVVALFL